MKRPITTYQHQFVDLSGSTQTTHVDLARVETIEYDNPKTKARLTLAGSGKQIEIYSTPETLIMLIEAWEKVRGFIVRVV